MQSPIYFHPFAQMPRYFLAPVYLRDAGGQCYVAEPKRVVTLGPAKPRSFDGDNTDLATLHQIRRCDEHGRIIPRVRMNKKARRKLRAHLRARAASQN